MHFWLIPTFRSKIKKTLDLNAFLGFAVYHRWLLELYFRNTWPLQIRRKVQSFFSGTQCIPGGITQLFQQPIDIHHNFAISPLSLIFIALKSNQWKFKILVYLLSIRIWPAAANCAVIRPFAKKVW